MSEKIAELVEAFEEANDKYWASPLGRSDSLHDRQVARLDATRAAILAEFEKLDAVREKLAEALQKMQRAMWAYASDQEGDAPPSHTKMMAETESALAANAELEVE